MSFTLHVPGVQVSAIWLTAQDLQVLGKTAEVLGNAADAAQFKATLATVGAAFNARFLKSGSYDTGSQMANALPLALGLVADAQRGAVLSSLLASVIAAQHRVTAGDIGFAYVLRALSQAGRGDVIFSMLKQSAGPGLPVSASFTQSTEHGPSSRAIAATYGIRHLGGSPQLAAAPFAPDSRSMAIDPRPGSSPACCYDPTAANHGAERARRQNEDSNGFFTFSGVPENRC